MALGKTVAYTPFEETSFGYGSAELATNYSTEFPNSDDIVKIVIEYSSGNFGATGHLSTPSSGTAVATYHELQQQLVIKGERDDVDAVLDVLSFYPADAPSTRTWTPTEWKANTTSGTYGDEEPPTITDTAFTIKAYDSGDTQQASETVTFSVTDPVFGNQRPFWSTQPPLGQDLNSSAHDTVAGGLVDFGTISHGSDTENVRVKCEFRAHGQNTLLTSTSGYGYFTNHDSIYVGDKKPSNIANTNDRFDFTGSVAEAQAFLDNVRYYNNGNERTFDMYLTISDGVVGSYVTRTVFFSDATIGVNTIADLNYVEDAQPANWDLGALNFTNVQPEVETFTATITLDATGRGGTTSFGTSTTVDTDSYNSSTGVLTIADDNLATFKTALRNLEFTPVADFNSSFTMTVDFTFSSSTYGSSYTATQQSIDITSQDEAEFQGLTSTHTWTEDVTYDFVSYPQIIHGYNNDFQFEFTLSDTAAGSLGTRDDGQAFARTVGGIFILSGSRDEMNIALANLFFTPSVDYDDNFTITFTAVRTSGPNLPATTENGTFTMNAQAVGEFTSTAPTLSWENNVSSSFDSGLRITDTATEVDENQIAFGSTYTVVARLRQGNSAFTNGKLVSTSRGLLTSDTGAGTNTYTMVGTKGAINTNLQNMKLIPDALYGEDETERDDFYVDYKITRDFDSEVFTDHSSSYRTTFSNPTIVEDVSLTSPLFDWQEDTVKDFDSGLQITSKVTDNSNYPDYHDTNYKATIRCKYSDGSNAQPMNSIDWSTTYTTDLTVSGKGLVSDPLIITGLKADVNQALQNLRLTPNTRDFTDAPSAQGNFWLEAQVTRVYDTVNVLNYSPVITNFNAGEPVDEYLQSWTNLSYIEDIADQRVFSNLTVITDGAGDIFDNVTYRVKISLDSELVGEFGDYVDDSYVVADYVDNYEIQLEGTKEVVNQRIQDIKFTPLADVTTSVTVSYSHTRLVDGVVDTSASTSQIGTITGVATPEYVYGTANNNKQYFVHDDYRSGIDITQSVANILAGNADATLTPKRLAQNLGLDYDRPITVTDAFEDGGESHYKIVFSGGTLQTTLGASLSVMDTDFQTKEDLHEILDDGLYVNFNGSEPAHDIQYHINFTLSRRAANGTVTQLDQGSLTYKFQTGLQLWHKNVHAYTSGLQFNRIDNVQTFYQSLNNLTVDGGTGYYVSVPRDYIPQPVVRRPANDELQFRRGNGQLWNDLSAVYARIYDHESSQYATYESSVHNNNTVYYHKQIGDDDAIWLYTLDAAGYDEENGENLIVISLADTSTAEISIKAWTPWGVLLKDGAEFDTETDAKSITLKIT